MQDTQRVVDVLVVGSGGGALVAALAAATAGNKVLVVEKLPVLGGTTAFSGGQFWIPCSPLLREDGLEDDAAKAWQYFDSLIGDQGPATSPARKKAYMAQGPQMVDFLRREGLVLRRVEGYPDYYADRPGGRTVGRGIEAEAFDGKKLGIDYVRINKRTLMPSLVLMSRDLGGISSGAHTWPGLRVNLAVIFRTLGALLTRRPLFTMGMALIGQLVHALRGHGVEMLTDAPLQRLIADASGKVTGAVVRHEGREVTIKANHGVILACGGFAHNPQMRAEYQPQVTGRWSSSAPGDQGDGIRAGLSVGAAVAQMDEAWWMPTTILPDGSRHMMTPERSKPYSIIVNQAGKRFVNECASYMEVGQRIFEEQRSGGGAVPSWFICDARHRRRYPYAAWPPRYTPRVAFESGYMIRAETLDELAQRCGIDAAGLKQTVERYNRMCANGKDEDFQRGDNPYDAYFGDPAIKPNATMGSLEQGPFYAVKVYPGDVGTNGGLLTDEHARVLRADGTAIEGLYATGNCAASVMGRVYPGPGGTIGPSMVFGYIAARYVAQRKTQTSN